METLIRTYQGKGLKKATLAFQADVALLSAAGWHPTQQTWEGGRSGCLRTILLGFVFAWAFPPAGTLTVTYQRNTPANPPSNPPTDQLTDLPNNL